MIKEHLDVNDNLSINISDKNEWNYSSSNKLSYMEVLLQVRKKIISLEDELNYAKEIYKLLQADSYREKLL